MVICRRTMRMKERRWTLRMKFSQHVVEKETVDILIETLLSNFAETLIWNLISVMCWTAENTNSIYFRFESAEDVLWNVQYCIDDSFTTHIYYIVYYFVVKRKSKMSSVVLFSAFHLAMETKFQFIATICLQTLHSIGTLVHSLYAGHCCHSEYQLCELSLYVVSC